MLGFLKIILVLLACMGLAHVLGNGNRTRTTIAFFSLAMLVWHLETKIEASRVTVNVDGKTIVQCGRVKRD